MSTKPSLHTVLVTPTCPYNDILWLFFLPGLSMASDVLTTTSLNCLLSQLQAVSCLRFCRGAVKGAAGLCSQRRNGNMLIKFHGNHFEGPTSGRRCLGSCGPRLGCSVDFEWRVASFPLCSHQAHVPWKAPLNWGWALLLEEPNTA